MYSSYVYELCNLLNSWNYLSIIIMPLHIDALLGDDDDDDDVTSVYQKFQEDGNCGRLLERTMEEEDEDNQCCEGGWGFMGTIFLLLPSNGKFSQYSTLLSWFHKILLHGIHILGWNNFNGYVLGFVEWKICHWRTYVVGNVLSPFIQMNVGNNIQSHHLAFPITIFVQLHNPLVLVATHHIGFHHS